MITIKVMISDEALAEMQRGVFVQGSLAWDLMTCKATFNKYRRTRTRRTVSRLLKHLDYGTLKETKNLIIRREAFQKRLGTARILDQMDDGNKQAKEALIERELGLIEFC